MIPDEVELSKVEVTYAQDLDCCQSEKEFPDACQILTLTTDDGGGGTFIRMKTGKAGWSISDVDELINLLADFKKRSD